jgi:uncharacterized protein
VLVGALAAYGVARSTVLPGPWHPWANVTCGLVVLAYGLAVGLSLDDVGLGRDRAAAGIRLGLVAFAVIAAVMAVAALVPVSREVFVDDSVDVGFGEMVFGAAIRIPLATALPEELVFRGVLLALLLRLTSVRVAVATSSLVFGVWHVPPLIGSDGAAGIIGTVVFTTVGGAAFAALRLRSGSLWAPVLAHVATNSTALVTAWIVTT